MTRNRQGQHKSCTSVLISAELECALGELYNEAQGYIRNDEFLLQFRGYCAGYVSACRCHLSRDESEMLFGYANVLLCERGGQPIR